MRRNVHEDEDVYVHVHEYEYEYVLEPADVEEALRVVEAPAAEQRHFHLLGA